MGELAEKQGWFSCCSKKNAESATDPRTDDEAFLSKCWTTLMSWKWWIVAGAGLYLAYDNGLHHKAYAKFITKQDVKPPTGPKRTTRVNQKKSKSSAGSKLKMSPEKWIAAGLATAAVGYVGYNSCCSKTADGTT